MDLYLDAEWFIGGDIFLIGWGRDSRTHGQLHDGTLTKERFEDILQETSGKFTSMARTLASSKNTSISTSAATTTALTC